MASGSKTYFKTVLGKVKNDLWVLTSHLFGGIFPLFYSFVICTAKKNVFQSKTGSSIPVNLHPK